MQLVAQCAAAKLIRGANRSTYVQVTRKEGFLQSCLVRLLRGSVDLALLLPARHNNVVLELVTTG